MRKRIFQWRRKASGQKALPLDDETPVCSSIDPDSAHDVSVTVSPSISLGTGMFRNHDIIFTPFFFGRFTEEEEITATASEQSSEVLACNDDIAYLRVADLPITTDEEWVGLSSGAAEAIAAIAGLHDYSEHVLFHEGMWTPDSKTLKILNSSCEDASLWKTRTFATSSRDGIVRHDDDDILVWSGAFQHDSYGHDIPAIRSAAVIPMEARNLLELLVDSSRVKEYNALSLGRTDLMVMDPELFGGTTKLMKSETRVLRKTLTFTSLLHAREVHDGCYQLVTRGIQYSDIECSSEILLGINRIIPCGKSCILLTVNHIKSPLVPMMIAKRIGLQAAVNFIHDIRKCA